MKRIIYILFAFLGCLAYSNVQAQSRNVGIGTNTPDNSAILDISSSSKGLLIPRLTEQQVNAISNPATGLMVFRTGEKQGFFYYNGKEWAPLTMAEANAIAADPNDWSFGGNAVPAGAFIGTTNNQPLRFKIDDTPSGYITKYNTAYGYNSFAGSGSHNTAVGINAMASNVASSLNVALGTNSLTSNTTGNNNMGIGGNSLYSNTTGNNNTAIGTRAMYLNTTGFTNVAIGLYSLYTNSTGSFNVAVGSGALELTPDKSNSTAIGYRSGYNSKGAGSVFIGHKSGFNESSDNKLYIANSDTDKPLIYGDFSAKFISIGEVPLAKRDAIASSGQYSLLVEKGILSEKLKVALKSTGDWADYVFEPEYKTTMMSLEEVEAFTLKNKHLPNVPSAEELVNKGLDFNETSKMFMEKIEELTLYMIELNKEVKALKAENALLKEAVKK